MSFLFSFIAFWYLIQTFQSENQPFEKQHQPKQTLLNNPLQLDACVFTLLRFIYIPGMSWVDMFSTCRPISKRTKIIGS